MDPDLKAEIKAAVRKRVGLAGWLVPFLPAIIEIAYRLILAWLDRKPPAAREAAFAANRTVMATDPSWRD